MQKADITMLLDYNHWATTRVLDAAASLTPSQWTTALDAQLGSLQKILVHMFNAERQWRIRFEQGVSPRATLVTDFPTVAHLRDALLPEQQAFQQFILTLDDALMEAPIQFLRFSGEQSQPFIRWQLLFQLIMHGIAHRSEVAAILTAYDHSPGDLDYLVYMLDHPA